MSAIHRAPAFCRAARSSFIGRTRELAGLKELLAQTRLLTLSGAGGVGKTRLALRVAAEAAGDFRDGVCWVELGALSDAALVPQAVAGALELREIPQQSLADFISSSLQPRQLLLVLDNCE